MKRALGAYLFALVAGCGAGSGTPQNPYPSDASAGCGTYQAAPSDAACSTLCAAHSCPTGFCQLAPNDAGAYLLTCSQDHTGRRPRGLARPHALAGCTLGRYLALGAHLEAASVDAFELLARELDDAGAPRALVAAARRSAREERRHARSMAQLAARHGAAVPAVKVRRGRARSLAALARENAIEGCVKETFGAALALHQARHAADPALRTALAAIAPDERRHAELAWRIDRWVRPQLDAGARANVARARAAAARRLLRRELAAPDSPMTAYLGLPPHAVRCAMARAIVDAPWA